METAVYLWIVIGVSLISAELFLPGMVVVFIGLAALAVAAGIGVGWLQTWTSIMTAWFVVSIVFLLGLRNLFARWLPGETEVGNMDEDLDALGQIVAVVRDTYPYNSDGRILFRGTSWSAQSLTGNIVRGGSARIVRREGNVWIIEPVTQQTGKSHH